MSAVNVSPRAELRNNPVPSATPPSLRTKPERSTTDDREPFGSPRKRGALDATIWLGVAVLVAGSLAITPLYLHNIVQDARVDGLEMGADGTRRLEQSMLRRLREVGTARTVTGASGPTEAAPGCTVPDFDSQSLTPKTCSLSGLGRN